MFLRSIAFMKWKIISYILLIKFTHLLISSYLCYNRCGRYTRNNTIPFDNKYTFPWMIRLNIFQWWIPLSPYIHDISEFFTHFRKLIIIPPIDINWDVLIHPDTLWKSLQCCKHSPSISFSDTNRIDTLSITHSYRKIILSWSIGL